MDKKEILKERFRIALTSTIKVISEKNKIEVDFKKKNLDYKNLLFLDLNNLKSVDDYTKVRAEADSRALKLKYSNQKIFQKNLPKGSMAKTLYNIAEQI